jgi:hypothetical protein
MRMKGCMIVAAVFLFCGVQLVHAIGRKALTPSQSPEAWALGLVEEITVANPYKEWKTLPGLSRFVTGSRPHGPLVAVFLNDKAFGSLEAGKPFGEGAILVVESYDNDKKHTAFDVMYKAQGYNPQGGDWYWLSCGPDGRVKTAGTIASCIGCHRAASDSEYILRPAHTEATMGS